MSLHLKTALCFEQWHHAFLTYVKIFLQQQGLCGLTPNQLMLIYHMKHDVMRMTEIAYGPVFWGSNICHNLGKLVRLGYLSRQKHPYDRRLTLIAIDEKGKNLRRQFQIFLEGDFFQHEGQKNRTFSREFLEPIYALFNPP